MFRRRWRFCFGCPLRGHPADTVAWLLLSVASFFASVASHAVLMRILPSANRPIAFLVTGGLIGLAMLVVVARMYGMLSVQLAGAAAFYAFACEFYLFLFSSAITSISMNILVRLRHQSLTTDKITRDYGGARMVERRIERLTSTGLMQKRSGDTYTVTARGHRLIGFLGVLRSFFRNGPHGT